MEKIDPRYLRGKIYTVRCYDNDTLIYVGSTIQPLSVRMAKHRSGKTCSLYKYVNGNWKNWYIELYEEYPCDNKQLLEKREGEITRLIGNINKQIAGRTHNEWIDDNKEKILEKQKEYNKNNKEKIKEKNKQYHIDNKDKIKEKSKQYHIDNKDKILEQKKQYRDNNKQKIKETDKFFYEANKEKIKERTNKYYHNNKEVIKEKKKEKVICDHCTCEVRKSDLARHKKTNKCKKYNITKE